MMAREIIHKYFSAHRSGLGCQRDAFSQADFHEELPLRHGHMLHARSGVLLLRAITASKGFSIYSVLLLPDPGSAGTQHPSILKEKEASMAMVLDAFASYVQNMLTEMVKEEVYMLIGVGDEIEKMDVKLGDLKNFLADADRRNITDKSVQQWVAQLKRAMYEAADILDLCQLKAMERSPSTKDVGCFNPLLFCMRNPSHAHDIGTRIKALNKRLDTIKERSAAFSFINLGSCDDRSSKVHGSHSGDTRRETSGEFDRSGVVGEKIEQDTKNLVEIMLSEKEGNTNIMVVAIVGVGGIGKTTLAQKVFNNEALNVQFEKMLWLSINKDFNKVELLRTIITQAGGVHGGEKALSVLQPILAATLKGKKLFMVLDDVWNHGAWDDVLKAPLANIVARGSRVLVTTRDERVARGMKAVLPYHHVDKLEEEDAWLLLKKQVVSSEADACEIDILKDIGLQIIAKCDGLPLAVKIDRAPAIKRVGPEFLQSYHHHSPRSSQVVAAFPRLHELDFIGMVEWEEWEWEEQVQAFPVLQKLMIKQCKLKCLPPGLAPHARALNMLDIYYVQGLICVENFLSLVELQLLGNIDVEMITNLPRLQKLSIENCPKLKVLEGVPALQRLALADDDMETLHEYMGGINLMHLELYCSLALLVSIAAGQSSPEWDKFSQVEHVKAYAREGDDKKKWYVLYRAKPFNLETNVSLSFMARGTLSYFEDAQRFESVFKMTRKTFSYICSLVMGPLMEDVNSYTFVDRRVLSLEDVVAVALKWLNSSEPTEAIGSSVGVNESTVLLVTERFVDALWDRAKHHLCWPNSSEKDKIKSMLGKNHNMHNCCGVICTTHILFGPSCNHETKNDNIQMQVVVDPRMRFVHIWLGPPGSVNHLSLLHESQLFKECEKGGWLNGSKLKVAFDGSEVGEYIIGDAGYPLLPWLLTPYEEEDLSDSKAEFNRRHSATTTCAPKALARLKDTWKCLHGETWWPANLETRSRMIYACCRLHNIVIEMEDDAAMLSTKRKKYSKEVRQIAKEDAIRARDMLSQHFMARRSSKSGVGPVDVEEDHEVAATCLGDENKEQEAETTAAEEERQC
ncbi:hypothetical protein ZWY2020_015776 [Hordeum vulgare]|nr:hypothetical protein ZWY2020_015776 [Hordeum vulgare]